MEQPSILSEYINALTASNDIKVNFVGKSLEKIDLLMQKDGLNNFEELFSLAASKNGVPENYGRPEQSSNDPYDIHNLIDYLKDFEPESYEYKVSNILKQFMVLEKNGNFHDTWNRAGYKVFATQRDDNARSLINNFGIPKSEEDINLLLKQFAEKGINVGSCAVTYASMLCEKTSEGNKYVDELISRVVAQCSQEDLERVKRNFRTYRRTITGAEEYNNNEEGLANFYGCELAPKNPEIRRRMLMNVFKGIVKNQNTTINDITDTMKSNPKISEDFTAAQWEVLQESIKNGKFELDNRQVTEDELFKIAEGMNLHDMDTSIKNFEIEAEKKGQPEGHEL